MQSFPWDRNRIARHKFHREKLVAPIYRRMYGYGTSDWRVAMAKQLNDKTMVDGQIDPADIGALKDQGVSMIINNRPDGEDSNQPTSDQISAAAEAAGIEYRHVPIDRGMGPAHVEAMRDAIHDAGEGKVFAFCRTGNRSTLAWALARNEDGVPREELERCAQGAGYSLDAIAHLLRD